MKFFLFILTGLAGISLLSLPQPQACTTLVVSNPLGPFVAKNLDWYMGNGLVFINRSDVEKTAIFVYAPTTPLTWTSHHLSVTFSHEGLEFPSEGMNDAGLSVDIMELDGSVFPAASDPRPGIGVHQWVQYILDQSSNLAEAIQNANAIRIVDENAGSHYMVCDSSSNCATFEYLNGNLVVHSGVDLPYQALTNNPYDQSMSNLQGLLSTQGEAKTFAGRGSDSLDRFARAALWSDRSKSDASAASNPVTYGFSALTHVSQTDTQWSIVFDLRSRLVHFRTHTNPAIRTVDLNHFTPSCAAVVEMLDVNAGSTGDVTSLFASYSAEANLALAQANTDMDATTQNDIAGFPARHTRCTE